MVVVVVVVVVVVEDNLILFLNLRRAPPCPPGLPAGLGRKRFDEGVEEDSGAGLSSVSSEGPVVGA